MNPTYLLSTNAEKYLTEYRSILSDMISGMSSASPTGCVSADFIAKMLPHHRAAIAMSRNFLRYTTDLTLQRIAENVISAHAETVSALERIRRTRCRALSSAVSSARFDLLMASEEASMLSRMESAPAENDIDRDFVLELLPHHEGAVRMARTALSFPVAPALVPVLRSIVESRSRTVRALRELSPTTKRAGPPRP